MPDDGDAPRLIARLVALDPKVNGADNVQDALTTGASGLQIGSSLTETATQDTATSLTADGGAHTITPLIAAPPAWMNTTGHITTAGVYQVSALALATAGPTTPGKYILVTPFDNAGSYLPCDGLGASGGGGVPATIALATADVPYLASVVVTMPTDATEAVDVLIEVTRLLHE